MSVDRSILAARAREGSGKGFARRLRAQKLIPAVVYSRHLEQPLHIALDPAAVRKAVNTPHRLNTLITLKIEGKGDQQVLLKDYQQDPVSHELLHADFVGVNEREPVKVKVPIELVGRPEGVIAGGILEQKRRDIEVWAVPTAIPEKIEVDVSHLKIANALHANDMTLPSGVKLNTNINYTIAVVTAPEAEIVAAPAPTAEAVPGAPGAPAAPVEGGAAAPAPGAAPAAAAAGEKKPEGGKDAGEKKPEGRKGAGAKK
jgi:large subunit ribosomal protein L25